MKLTILSPGPLSTIQDAGRFGAMGKGFSPGGAVDAEAMTLANLLVGNAPGVGVIEMPMLGITARFGCDCTIALTGADMCARLNDRPVERYCSIPVHSGDVLSMKAAKSGMRAYLAVAGGFGRRNMNLSPAEVQNLITYQVGALSAFCRSAGVRLRHVKPHGALYNMAAKDPALAKAICQGIYSFDPSLILLGLSGSEMLKQAKEIGLPCAAEIFADRAYEDDGTLVSRTKPGAMITDEDEAVRRVIRMILEHKVTSINGKEIEICPDSVRVHGDSAKALLFVKKIRAALEAAGITIQPL